MYNLILEVGSEVWPAIPESISKNDPKKLRKTRTAVAVRVSTALLHCAVSARKRISLCFVFSVKSLLPEVIWQRKTKKWSTLCIQQKLYIIKSPLIWPRGIFRPIHKGEYGFYRLPSRRKFSACVQLAFRLATHLRWLWSSSNSYASPRKLFTVWPPNVSRHKLIASQLYMREIYDFLRLVWTCKPTCESVWPPIASPYASSGFAKLASTCESVWPGLSQCTCFL